MVNCKIIECINNLISNQHDFSNYLKNEMVIIFSSDYVEKY